jgi:flagellar hook-basal body complex protein FliE
MEHNGMAVSSILANPALRAYAEATNRAQASDGDNANQAIAPNFGQLLAQTASDAIDASRSSEAISIQAASGRVDLQDVVEAVNAAEISLQTVVSIRDRVISAYQEIMRMPI